MRVASTSTRSRAAGFAPSAPFQRQGHDAGCHCQDEAQRALCRARTSANRVGVTSSAVRVRFSFSSTRLVAGVSAPAMSTAMSTINGSRRETMGTVLALAHGDGLNVNGRRGACDLANEVDHRHPQHDAVGSQALAAEEELHVGHLAGLQGAVEARRQHQARVQIVVFYQRLQGGGGLRKRHLDTLDVADVLNDLRFAFVNDAEPGHRVEQAAEHHANQEREDHRQDYGVQKDWRARPNAQVLAQQVPREYSGHNVSTFHFGASDVKSSAGAFLQFCQMQVNEPCTMAVHPSTLRGDKLRANGSGKAHGIRLVAFP